MFTLHYPEKITDIITLGAAILGGVITIYIYYQNSKHQRAQVLFLLFEKFFYQAKYAEIRQLLDYNEDKIRQFQEVLAHHGDELLEEKFVDYLNFFEFIASLVQLKQLEINEVQSMFDYYIRGLGNHEFIKNYLEDQNFKGLNQLVEKLRKLKLKEQKFKRLIQLVRKLLKLKDEIDYEYIFVYGTLRRDTNSGMYHLLAKHAKYVDEATYCGKLYKIDDYPGVTPSNDLNDIVHGEVYLLHHADIVLPRLDQYEEYGPEFPQPNEYIREKQEVFLRSGSGITAWVYLYNRPTEGLELIESADFLNLLS